MSWGEFFWDAAKFMAEQYIYSSQKERRDIESICKEVCEPVGDVMEAVNNVRDSTVNLAKGINPVTHIYHALTDLSVEEGLKFFQKGDHIATLRSVYSHHGIYDGNGGVWEYNDYKVRHSSLSRFANGDKLYLVDEGASYSPEKIVERAMNRKNESQYNVVFNNCENFATWCRLGWYN